MNVAAVALLLLLFFTMQAKGTNAAGLKFLEENKSKEGVIVRPSGLQYKIIKKGAGTKSPLVSTSCSCHYVGTLPSGQVFDSSRARGKPSSFAPNQVIKGWTEIMQIMHEGDQFELYIPSELAYGDSARGAHIKAGDVLIFDLELLKIEGASKDTPSHDEL